ncbi:MAG: hypothetical protein ACPGYT_08155 [Nitrospirales bacterium]
MKVSPNTPCCGGDLLDSGRRATGRVGVVRGGLKEIRDCNRPLVADSCLSEAATGDY